MASLFITGWGQWSPFGDCSATCGVGTRIRNRFCNGGNPGSAGCPGYDTETIICNLGSCSSKYYFLVMLFNTTQGHTF